MHILAILNGARLGLFSDGDKFKQSSSGNIAQLIKVQSEEENFDGFILVWIEQKIDGRMVKVNMPPVTAHTNELDTWGLVHE